METELQKHIDALDRCYEQWLQRTKDDFDSVDSYIKELEEPYKTEFMWDFIRNLQEWVFYAGKAMIRDEKRILYQTTIRDYTTEALRHESNRGSIYSLGCLLKVEELSSEYENGILKEGLQ